MPKIEEIRRKLRESINNDPPPNVRSFDDWKKVELDHARYERHELGISMNPDWHAELLDQFDIIEEWGAELAYSIDTSQDVFKNWFEIKKWFRDSNINIKLYGLDILFQSKDDFMLFKLTWL